jgi:hypothetical protein
VRHQIVVWNGNSTERACTLLVDQRLARLAQALEEGPAAHGFDEDQRWTLTRVSDLIARMFHIRHTCVGCRICCTAWGSPHPSGGRTRRGRDRDVAAGDVGGGKTVAAERGAQICSEDEAGQTLHPPKARTWGRRGRTPVVAVSEKVRAGSRSPGWSVSGPVAAAG